MPVAGANDDISIFYGAFEVGGATGRLIHGENPYRLTYSGDRVTLEYAFWVFGATDATFTANCQAVVDAYSEIRLDSTVEISGSPVESFSHTDGTGLDASPTLAKAGDPGDTVRSRLYSVSIEMGRQNTTDSNNGGRRESSILVIFTPARLRTVTLAGEYIKGGGTGASARYSAGIGAFQTAALASLSPTGIFELAEEETEINTDDTILRFRRVVDEILEGQPTNGPVDHPEITRQSIVVTQIKSLGDNKMGGNGNVKIGKGIAGGGTAPIKSGGLLTRLQVTYECWVRFDVTKDLNALWKGTIRPAIISRAVSVIAAGSVVVEDESVSFDIVQNRITATLMLLATKVGDVLESSLTTEDNIKKGTTLVPVLTTSRNPYTKYSFRGPGQIIRIVTETNSIAQATFTPPFTDFTPREVEDPTGDAAGKVSNSAIIDVRETRSRRSLGIDGAPIQVHDYTCITQIEFFSPYGGGTTAGGSSNKLA